MQSAGNWIAVNSEGRGSRGGCFESCEKIICRNSGSQSSYLHPMKTIGLIGGVTWLSTAEYYKLLNELVNEREGGVSSARVIIYSLNFQEIKP